MKKLLTTCLLGYSAMTWGASPDAIGDPPDFQWTHHPASGVTEEYYSGVLEYGQATFTIGGETLTTRAYRQEGFAYSIPGPTLRMTPGKKYVVQFRNTLPFEPKSEEHNTFKDPNVTNLHTHGMHISPASPSDDVLRFFEGGTGGDFVYDISADHMGGTYWYHAHHHGSTFLQVATGALGSIVIDDGGDGLPAHVAAMEEKNLVINFLDPGAAGTGGDTLVSGTLGRTWLVNGQVGGTVNMPPNTWQHWRVLLADPDASNWKLSIGSQCEIALLARDGVWRLTGIPKNLSPDNSISMHGASRSDLAVRCSAESEIRVGNTVVAAIGIDGTEDSTVHPYAADGGLWYANRPAYLRDMRAIRSVHSETISMGARTINSSKFDASQATITLPATDTQEWKIKGATNHPFHLHVYHMQATENCGDHEAGEFYDTIAASCLIRFDLNASTSSVFDGGTVMHCHVLSHEDQGAMGWIDVVGGKEPPTYPAGTTDYRLYYTLGGNGEPPLAPSSLAAVAVSSDRIDLSWIDNAADEDGFELERSTDGINFALEASLGANVTGYSDSNGLAADTTYYYRARATGANGNSGYSNIASATTDPDVAGTTMVVDSLTVTTVNAGKGQKHGRAVVVIADNLGGAVEGAVVSGSFSGSFNESVTSAPTDASGTTTIDTGTAAKGGITLTFCVDSIDPPAGSALEPYNGPQVCAAI